MVKYMHLGRELELDFLSNRKLTLLHNEDNPKTKEKKAR